MSVNEENKVLSLGQGRQLITNTSLSHLDDHELQELLEVIKVFCEINYELYLDFIRQQKIEEMNKDYSSDNVRLLNENKDENLLNAA